MKRIFLLKGLDCPNCSAKIEKEVGELDGVQSSVVNLMKQTLTINVASAAANTIASQIETIVHSHEPDVEVSEIVQESYIPEKKQEANESYNNEDKKLTIRLAIGAAIYTLPQYSYQSVLNQLAATPRFSAFPLLVIAP